ALLLEGLIMVLYSFIPFVGISVLICFFWGINVSIMLIPYYSIMQEIVQENFSGRVFSLAKQSEGIAILLAICLAIGLHDAFNPNQIFTVVGTLYFLIIATSAPTPSGREILRTM